MLNFKGAGVRLYRTILPLSIHSSMDVLIASSLNASDPQTMRAQLFVTGY